jgi:predicted PurR-regulated permease PerM
VALLWIAWQVVRPILRTLLLFAFAGVLAFALAAPVEAIAARLRHRALAVVAVYLLVGATAVGGLTLLAGPFVAQATALGGELPRYAAEIESRAPEVEGALARYGVQASAAELKARAAQAVEAGAADLLRMLVGALAELGALLVDIILALVISFYLLLDGPALRRRALALFPAVHRQKALFLEEHTRRVLGGYLRGQLLLAASVGLAAGLGCWALGLPYAVVLGVLAGLFELVPMFGPVLSAVPAVLVALFQPFPTVLWVVGFFLILQQVESHILVPRVSGHAVGLHPLGALFALLVGFQLAGPIGALFAVPVAGLVWVLLGAAYRQAAAPPTVPVPRLPRLPRFPRLRPQAGRAPGDAPRPP